MKIEAAKAGDSSLLTELAMASKAYWNYTPQQLNEWKDELTVTEQYIAERHVYKCICGSKIVGFYALSGLVGSIISLDFLFVLPDYIGCGLGSLLAEHAIEMSKQLLAEAIMLDADPNATAFYEKLGFEVLGQKESTIPGRYLPVMRKMLS
ncbi:GNAT family N-acetyltransferase [Cesiribacter sp. SM1]|uniref:GNAT family N-acetyltransferase n=1 Tax=Cesiribacter sp. SM1 TaxID=2861196 RepID=UPI001CD2EA1D|nr:GNAT family N-acetyltransferase [Cesiribacter sp. SM1]